MHQKSGSYFAPLFAALLSELIMYSDGSATAGIRDGGAGVIVTFSDPADPPLE